MDEATREFLDDHEHSLMRRVRKHFGVVPIALPIPAIEAKAKADGVSIQEAVKSILDDDSTPEAREWLRMMAEEAANNTTCFFRGPDVFDHFRTQTLPALIAARQDTKTLRLWSVGCSSGQEAYSLATILLDEPALAGWDVKVIATDIDREALDEARKGEYVLGPAELLQGGDVGTQEWRDKHLEFDPVSRRFTVKQDVRDIVDFREHNICDGPYAIGEVDTIFCRHVLMHFTRDTGRAMLHFLNEALPADGCLYLGRGEGAVPAKPGEPALFDHVDMNAGVACFRPLNRPVRPAIANIPGAAPVADPDTPEEP